MTDASLPPLPWDWVASATPTSNGMFHIYLIDANGRKIAALWGKADEREAAAKHIVALVNKDARTGVGIASGGDGDAD